MASVSAVPAQRAQADRAEQPGAEQRADQRWTSPARITAARSRSGAFCSRSCRLAGDCSDLLGLVHVDRLDAGVDRDRCLVGVEMHRTERRELDLRAGVHARADLRR